VTGSWWCSLYGPTNGSTATISRMPAAHRNVFVGISSSQCFPETSHSVNCKPRLPIADIHGHPSSSSRDMTKSGVGRPASRSCCSDGGSGRGRSRSQETAGSQKIGAASTHCSDELGEASECSLALGSESSSVPRRVITDRIVIDHFTSYAKPTVTAARSDAPANKRLPLFA